MVQYAATSARYLWPNMAVYQFLIMAYYATLSGLYLYSNMRLHLTLICSLLYKFVKSLLRPAILVY